MQKAVKDRDAAAAATINTTTTTTSSTDTTAARVEKGWQLFKRTKQETEWEAFKSQDVHFVAKKHLGQGVTLEGLASVIVEYDPLEFWSNEGNRLRFPNIFLYNVITLAYLSCDVFQEACFSVANDVFGPNRMRSSPELMEATAVESMTQRFCGSILSQYELDEDDGCLLKLKVKT
jgi:hypothetical protein